MKTLVIACALTLALDSSAALGQDTAPKAKKAAKLPKQSDPEKYAAALAALLTDYQKQVADKIAAEELAYTAAAKLYDSAFRTDITASLTLDRMSDYLLK